MTSTLLTAEVLAMIGREAVYVAPEEIGRAAFRYFATAVGDDNPVYTDDARARAAGWPGVIAPPTLICETNQYCRGPRNEEGYIGHTWDLDIPRTRVLRGGNAYEFFQPVRPDDVITATWRIEDIVERTTSAGVPMLIVSSVATYTNQREEILARNTETIIVQSMGER